ncbi:hypothetical protein, partial [Roseiarcus sp.]|uniref:hypothetical protein n=1 Tax=Roseiarcus sp. TaxID=1969460 RepID=UPI003F9D60BE
GFEPPDLPFDLRGRRVLQYALAEEADAETRNDVKRRLIGELTAAIRTNLDHYIEAEAAALSIHGVPAKVDEPSLWAGSENGFSHLSPNGRGDWISVTIPAGPRVYRRVIPSGWKTKPPAVAEIQTS